MSGWLVRASMLCGAALVTLAAGPVHAGDTAVALRATVTAETARPTDPRFARRAFLARAQISDVNLSPDGRHIAYRLERGGKFSVWLLDTAGGAPRQLLPHTDATQLLWSHDSRWLFLPSARQVFALAVAGQTGSGIVSMLGGHQRRELVAVDPLRPAAVIIREHRPATPTQSKRWQLLRVDMHGKRHVLLSDAHPLIGFAFNPDGKLAFVSSMQGTAKTIVRVDGSGKKHVVAHCRNLHTCTLLPVTNAEGRPWLRGNLKGNLTRLLRIDAQGHVHTEHVDPRNEADVAWLVLDPTSGQPLIANYRSAVARDVGLTPAMTRQMAVIKTRFPRHNLSIQVGRGAHARWLIGEQASTLQGERWHLYDPKSGRFHEVLDFPPLTARSNKPTHWLPESGMARKIPFDWTASDGMRLHGFVWLPPGVNPAKTPLLTVVHGGPWTHAHPGQFGSGFNQFLVNRGYAIFEPNFRGSTGFGRNYTLAPQGDFGNGRVQRDIVEGTQYLLAHGIGDPQRVGIIGASFGGYSTLLGVTFSPQLFKVGIAIVPPADFGWTLQRIVRGRYAAAMCVHMACKSLLRMYSLDIDDPATMQRLHAQSPLANARKLHRPLLLLASGADSRVAIRGVIQYAAKLKLLGKKVGLFVDPDADHINKNPLANEAYFYLAARMLHHDLGGAAATPPDAALTAYLQRTQRLPAPDAANIEQKQ